MAPVWQDFLRGERTQFLCKSNTSLSCKIFSNLIQGLLCIYAVSMIIFVPFHVSSASYIMRKSSLYSLLSFSSILPRTVHFTTISRNSIDACTLFPCTKNWSRTYSLVTTTNLLKTLGAKLDVFRSKPFIKSTVTKRKTVNSSWMHVNHFPTFSDWFPVYQKVCMKFNSHWSYLWVDYILKKNCVGTH